MREERFWKGVSEPQRLEEILNAGDAAGLEGYLAKQEPAIAATVRVSAAKHDHRTTVLAHREDGDRRSKRDRRAALRAIEDARGHRAS